MSLYTIEIKDDVVTEQINNILNTIFNNEMQRKYCGTGEMLSVAIKELVYSHKEEIIEKVVDRAVKEIVRKGMPRLLERMGNDG
jgi:ABC-type siderophore export system fused ATPase/permease subunit